MSRIKPMELISKISGKLCSHSDIYFAERNGTQYTGKICNPYQGAPSADQLTARQVFCDTIRAINELTEEQKAAYSVAFKKQKKHKTLRGYTFAMEYNKLKNNNH